MDNHDIPDQEIWYRLFRACRSVPGMGDMRVIFNPYECNWMAQISFSDNTRFIGEHKDINQAMILCLQNFETSGYKGDINR